MSWLQAVQGMVTLETVKDWVTILAAVIGIVVATRGLSTWRLHLRLGQEHEVARRLLKATLRMREEFRIFRNPWISAEEHSAANSTAGGVKGEGGKDLLSEPRAIYSRRQGPLVEAYSEYRTACIDAEVAFGAGSLEIVSGLDAAYVDLGLAVQDLVRYSESGNILSPAQEEAKEESLAIVKAALKGDAFGQRIDDRVRAIEEFARRHLAR